MPGTPKKNPTVARTDAAAVLAEAAQAVGVDFKVLCDMVVDGGYVDDAFVRAEQALTKTFTLGDLGKQMFVKMQDSPARERVRFFRKLSPTAQKGLLVVLKQKGYSPQTIATDLHLNLKVVTRTINEFADELGAQVAGLRLHTIAGQLQLTKDAAQALELQKGNGRAAWAIEKEFLQSLQSLGVVDRAIHKVEHEHKHSFGDERQAEVDRMVELEFKKKRAAEEVKQIDATVTDTVPEVM